MEEKAFSLMEIPNKPYRSRGRGRGRGRGKRKKAKMMKTPEKKVKQKQNANKQTKQKKQTNEKEQPEKGVEKKKTDQKKKKSGSKSKPKKKDAEKGKPENSKKNQEGGKKKKVTKKSSKKKAPKSEGNVKKAKDQKGKQTQGEKKQSKGKGKAANKKVNKQQAQKKAKPGKKNETQKKKQGKGETQKKKQKQQKTQKQGKAGKAQKSQKKSQKKPQTQQQSGAGKQTKKGKKRKMNIRSRLLGYCRKAKPEAKVIAMFSQELVNDIRFKAKYSSRIEISLNNEGMRSYTTKPAAKKPQEQPKKQQKAKAKTEKVLKKAQPQKKAQPKKKAQAKKKKVSVRDEFFKACRATKAEKDLIAQFGQKLIEDVRFKDKFKSRIEITLDKDGNRAYTTKRSLKAQRKKERNLRKNGIRAAYKNFVDMGSAANFEACQNEIREHFADWSETDSNFLQKLHENEVFKKECTFPVLFWNLTSSVNTFEFIKRVSAFGESNAKRLSPNQLIVNFKAKDAATKCVNKLNNALIQGRKIPCKFYLTQNVESSV